MVDGIIFLFIFIFLENYAIIHQLKKKKKKIRSLILTFKFKCTIHSCIPVYAIISGNKGEKI